MPTLQEWIACRDLPLAMCNKYRVRHGLTELTVPNTTATDVEAIDANALTVQLTQGVSTTKRENKGPGTEFKKIADSLGVENVEGCDCGSMQARLDDLGVVGCRKHRAVLLKQLRKNAGKVKWIAKARAAVNVAVGKAGFWINPLDPVASIFDEAVRRADGEKTPPVVDPPIVELKVPTVLPEYKALTWEYGVTTVPMRRHTTLPRTLESLHFAGFGQPRLFIDGIRDPHEHDFHLFGLETTCRFPAAKVVGNWILSIWELYIRNSDADRYAIFQDDFVTYPNLREYLDRVPYPDRGYCNLYTFPANERKAQHGTGWFKSNQNGLGAVALVFTKEAVRALFSNLHLFDKCNAQPNRCKNCLKLPEACSRCWDTAKRLRIKAVDGGIVTAMTKAGWHEYCHMPSLVQHIGDVSSAGNGKHAQAESFRGEQYNVLGLLK